MNKKTIKGSHEIYTFSNGENEISICKKTLKSTRENFGLPLIFLEKEAVKNMLFPSKK